MEVGEEGDYYTYRYTVTTRMTPALRWAVMRAILMFQREKVTRQYPQTAFFEEKGPSAYKPNALPLGQTVSHRNVSK